MELRSDLGSPDYSDFNFWLLLQSGSISPVHLCITTLYHHTVFQDQAFPLCINAAARLV